MVYFSLSLLEIEIEIILKPLVNYHKGLVTQNTHPHSNCRGMIEFGNKVILRFILRHALQCEGLVWSPCAIFHFNIDNTFSVHKVLITESYFSLHNVIDRDLQQEASADIAFLSLCFVQISMLQAYQQCVNKMN